MRSISSSPVDRPDAGRGGDELVVREADGRADLERLQRMSYWLDDRFRIPLTGRRIGLDGLIGLIPGAGDAATTLVSLYIIADARRLGVPASTLLRMGMNVGIDSIVGLVPFFGDLFDVAWKSNRRNVRLILDHLERQGRIPGDKSAPA